MAETSPARWPPLPDINGHIGGVTANTRANMNAGRVGRNGQGCAIRPVQERRVAG
jgi:hypothetical protein